MPLLPLIGHDRLRARLSEQVAAGTLPSSILLHGPAGIGKQRLALWLGQRLLCTGEPAPCGTCQHCQYALQLAHPDLLYYFPRPNYGTDPSHDEVRAEYEAARKERADAHGLYGRPEGAAAIQLGTMKFLVFQSYKTPAMAARKVFVVGDADRTVTGLGGSEAANAFLKLLEEPPADTTLILTTSEAGALLPTIRSRVVSFRVNTLSDDEVRAFLAQPPAADAAGKGTVEQLVRAAAGAPGTLIGAEDRSKAVERARRLLESTGQGAEALYRSAFTQGSSKSRGAFSDVLDAMTVLLHERAQNAVQRGDALAAAVSAKAMLAVEEAKLAAAGNGNPQAVTYHLLRELSAVGA